MDVLKVLGCLIFLFGFVFGNQPGQHLFLKEQSVFIPDWRNEILIPNGIVLSSYYSLTNTEISNMQANDSIHMQKTPSDASRVTFGKIMLESAGALAGGFLLAYPISQVNKYDWQVGYLVGFSIGPAVGTTLVGNTLMEPNGSFLKSFIGSTLGVALGVELFISYVISGGCGCDPERKEEEIWYIHVTVLGLPMLGAITGYNYNFGTTEINRNTINFNGNFDDFNKMTLLQRAKYKLSLITVKF